jgi:hypothetical protein
MIRTHRPNLNTDVRGVVWPINPNLL